MTRFILQRLLQGIVVIIAVISITFLIIRLGPGSPFANERDMPEYVRDNLDRLYGLDQPLWVQLGRNLWSFITLDLPVSYKLKGWNVGEIIAQGLPVSFTVGGAAFVIAVLVALPPS